MAKIVVNFSRGKSKTYPTRPWSDRKFGGTGFYEKIRPWKDGMTMKLEGHARGRKRTFLAVNRRSSTGSGVGSFRID